MPRKNKADSRLAEALAETADGMFRLGIMDEKTHRRITARRLPESERSIEVPVPSSEDIRAMREKANMSQAVFARRLNVTPGYISQLERGVKRPTGAAVVLLNLIRKRGIDAIS